MLEAIEYIERNGGACICRCLGEGGYLELPERIEGLKVTALADHVFAREPSFLLRNVPKRVACPAGGRGQWRDVKAGEAQEDARRRHALPALCEETLREIVLPGALKSVGNYAFYGCRYLERVTFPADMNGLGSGAFVDCHRVRELTVTLPSGEKAPQVSPGALHGGDSPLPALRQVLAEIADEVEVCLQGKAGETLWRLHFPEYYEDSVENTPARIFVMQFEGTGFKYRQCFRDERIDFARYDALFYEASVQEFPPTVLRMCFDRLFWPVGLGEEARAQYTDYILADMDRLLAWCMPGETAPETESSGGMDALAVVTFLTQRSLLDREMTEAASRRAVLTGRADVVSLLADYRRTRFARPKARERYRL